MITRKIESDIEYLKNNGSKMGALKFLERDTLPEKNGLRVAVVIWLCEEGEESA